MYHCRQCRADAVGTLDQDLSRTLTAGAAGVAACAAASASGPGGTAEACAAASAVTKGCAASGPGAACAEEAASAVAGGRAALSPAPEEPALRFAVASGGGYVVDQHFGHATGFYVYECQEGQVSLLERRDIPQYCFGPDGCRDHEELFAVIGGIIQDCAGVIVMRIGEAPRLKLAGQGIRVFMTYNYVTDAVREAATVIRNTATASVPVAAD
jgi:predicted Fe-Mo cluster-binding NifX family protein